MDLSRLDAAILGKIPKSSSGNVIKVRGWLRPMRAAAAIIVITAVAAGLLMVASGGPVVALPSDMAKFHDDMVSGRTPVTPVDSVAAADEALKLQWEQSPKIPNIPTEHTMACCMRSVKNRKVCCVLLKGADQPVTLTVANASDMKCPNLPMVTRNGNEYCVQSFGQLNMVMTRRQGRCVCLIAKLPVERLMDLASTLEF